MARLKSPKYPNFPLYKAIELTRMVYDADRTSPLPREVIAKHLGYSGVSGASDATIATIVQYGLLERHGKGEMRVSANAVDIFFPEDETQKQIAVNRAAMTPPLFNDIINHFEGSYPSELALKTYLHRREFHEKAISLVSKSFPETMNMFKQSKDSESDSNSSDNIPKTGHVPSEDGNVVFGGARVGDFVQWEQGGDLKLPEPTRVRQITEDGEWVFVEGFTTGIPMSQTIVEPGVISPPTLALSPASKPIVLPLAFNNSVGNGGEDNQINVIMSGDILHIHCDNVTADGLAVLLKKLQKYQEILEIDISDTL